LHKTKAKEQLQHYKKIKGDLVTHPNSALIVCDFTNIQLEAVDLQDLILVLYRGSNGIVSLMLIK
jgi:hypothetical protein